MVKFWIGNTDVQRNSYSHKIGSISCKNRTRLDYQVYQSHIKNQFNISTSIVLKEFWSRQIFRGAVRTLILKLHFLPTTQLVCSDHVHTHSRKQDSTRNVHQLCIHRLTRDHAQTHNIDTKTRRQETTQDRY